MSLMMLNTGAYAFPNMSGTPLVLASDCLFYYSLKETKGSRIPQAPKKYSTPFLMQECLAEVVQIKQTQKTEPVYQPPIPQIYTPPVVQKERLLDTIRKQIEENPISLLQDNGLYTIIEERMEPEEFKMRLQEGIQRWIDEDPTVLLWNQDIQEKTQAAFSKEEYRKMRMNASLSQAYNPVNVMSIKESIHKGTYLRKR